MSRYRWTDRRYHHVRRYAALGNLTYDPILEKIFANNPDLEQARQEYFPTAGELCQREGDRAIVQMNQRHIAIITALQSRSFYPTPQFKAVLFSTQDLIKNITDKLAEMISDPWWSHARLPEARLRLFNLIAVSTRDYLPSLQYAEAHQIPVIDSPGFWRWVNKVLDEVELATQLMAITTCMKPWYASVLAWLYERADSIYQLAKTAVSVAIAVGSAVLKIPDTIGSIWTILKWGVLIGGAAYVYQEVQDHRKGGGG
jgi:hypothetical protein